MSEAIRFQDGPPGAPRVLVVDADPRGLQALREALDGQGYRLLVARDGEAALRIAAEARPDLVLLDAALPGMDGFAVLERLKADPATRHAAVVLLSAGTQTGDSVKALERGAVDYVPKPFQRGEVLARVRAHLTIRELERHLSQRNRQLEEANRKMKADLDAAARVQRALLPSHEPRVEGLRFAWHYQPCLALAGDSLGVLPLDAHHVGLYVLDVSGHGVSSALLSVAVTRSLSLRADPAALVSVPGPDGTERVRRPAEVASRLNRLYPMAENGMHYFTLTYGVVDPTSGRFEFVSPGNPGPILSRPGQAPRIFDRPAVPIGLLPDSSYEDARIDLEPGDRLYLHSDGVHEERNPREEEFGRDRLLEHIEQAAAMPFEEGFRFVTRSVREWRGARACRDDLAMLALQYRG